MTAADRLDEVRALHARVDRRARALEVRHGRRLQCRLGCSGCCVDDITVFEAEAARIRAEYPDVLQGTPGPIGACAFLDAGGACRVYLARPYVCRTQGLPLRWFDEVDDQVVELRDICALNETPEPIESLAADDCWLLGPAEGVLAEIQASTGRAGARVALRDLFRR